MTRPNSNAAQVSALLHQAAETHHVVFAITDGTDADWASWYSDWLINLSSLADLLGVKPVRSELTYLLVMLDMDYSAEHPSTAWEDYYAAKLLEHFTRTP